MKIVIGMFAPENSLTAVRRLTGSGFDPQDLSAVSAASDIPSYLADDIEGEPEQAAASGAAAGGLVGGSLGLLGSWVASTIPGFEAFSVAGLMATASGTAIGTYLGSLYSTRAETQTKIDLHEGIESGKVLLLLKTGESQAERAASLMTESSGEDVEIHDLPTEEDK